MHGRGLHGAHLQRVLAIHHQHVGLPVGAALHGPLRHQDGGRVHALAHGHAHIHAGQQHAVAVVEAPAQRHLAGAAVHRHIREQQLPRALQARAIHLQGDRRAVLALRLCQAALGQGRAQALGFGHGLLEVCIDRVELLDQRHGRGLALAHQGALGDQRTADAARDRRPDRGVFQVQGGRLHLGLGGLPRGLGRLQAGLHGLEVLAADCLLRHQRRVAADHGTRFDQGRLGAGQLALGAGQGGAQGRRVDLEQHLAGPDVGAFLEMAAQHDAGHPRTHLGHAHGLDTARQLAGQGQRRGLHGDGLHHGQRITRCGRSLVAAAARCQGGQHQGRQRQATSLVQTHAHVHNLIEFDTKAAMVHIRIK